MNKDKLIKTFIIFSNFSTIVLHLMSYLRKSNITCFLKHQVKKNTLLVTDPTLGHGEVMPGIIKYCLDLGFNVEVLITEDKNQEKPFTMFKNLKIFSFEPKAYMKILTSDKLNEYKKVIFTSSRIYCGDNADYNEQFIFDYLGEHKIEDDKILFIEHHLDLPTQEEKQKYNFVGLPEISANFGMKMVNPHYFGKNRNKNKNKTTRFVVTGSIQEKRKNHLLLIDAIQGLLDKKIYNFEIIVIGRGKLEIKNNKIRDKIKFTGRITYEKMYKIITDCDYILGLLDPNNTLHDRYVKYGTSGTFQLSYGFLKPLIINEKFAISHGLNDSNSIIYKDNNLLEAMECAINESNSSYTNRRNELQILANKIYEKSLENIKLLTRGTNES